MEVTGIQSWGGALYKIRNMGIVLRNIESAGHSLPGLDKKRLAGINLCCDLLDLGLDDLDPCGWGRWS